MMVSKWDSSGDIGHVIVLFGRQIHDLDLAQLLIRSFG